MTHATQTSVWAFPRRSNYDQTYGTSADRAGLASAQDRIKADAQAMKRYRRQLSEYQKRLAAHQQDSKDNSAQLPNESPPILPRKTAGVEDETLVRHATSRDEYEQSIGYPLDGEGAVRPVRAGDTPTGLPATLRQYQPL